MSPPPFARAPARSRYPTRRRRTESLLPHLVRLGIVRGLLPPSDLPCTREHPCPPPASWPSTDPAGSLPLDRAAEGGPADCSTSPDQCIAPVIVTEPRADRRLGVREQVGVLGVLIDELGHVPALRDDRAAAGAYVVESAAHQLRAEARLRIDASISVCGKTTVS